MTQIRSFPPISGADARVLILGSMPGKASLAAGEYYAHPRNSFWRIMGVLQSATDELSYTKRCRVLIDSGIAVWDVLKACTRSSSLDSDIVESSIVPNDFDAFFARHREIRGIYFNGAKAEQVYVKHVLPQLPEPMVRMPRVRLPSTSPANASWSFERKLEAWRVAVADG